VRAQAHVRLKHQLRRLARRAGYDVVPFNAKWSPVARRGSLLRSLGIDVVLDVGANEGQYATELRNDVGFGGRICSFEPVSSAYRLLQAQASRDPRWTTFNFALGDNEGRATINVAANSESSSILEMLPAHVTAEPESHFVTTEEIEMKTLDVIFEDVTEPGERVYLKIDTQGFEDRVLSGAAQSLPKICTIQVEMALAPLYESAPTFADLFQRAVDNGYTMVGLEPGFSDMRTGRLLQVDCIFHRVL
jgi:FkbM family methyltransferase